MEVPEGLAEEFGVAIKLRRLWGQYPEAALSVGPTGDGAYKASAGVPGGPTADGHSERAVHALSRALVHLGLDTDLTEYP